MKIRWLNFCFVIAVAILVVACTTSKKEEGGTSQSQLISFANPGPINSAVGTTVNNAASGGGGAGAISYAGSNATVATVNPATGAVNLLAVGSTTITATKAASAGFNQATANYSITVTQGTQVVAFTQVGPINMLVGSGISNTASGGSGSGAVTYVSSNANAVMVDQTTGAATATGVGTAVITATKVADINYTQAQATYTINSQTADKISAFIGTTGTDVSLPASANDKQFGRARVSDCSVTDTVATCTGAELNPVNAVSISDTRATLATPAYYAIINGSTIGTPIDVRADRFSNRLGHAAVYFNNRYWVIGGGEPTLPSSSATIQYTAKADVWSSADGKTWKLETSDGGFGARWFHQAVVFNNRIWIISGDPTPLHPFPTPSWLDIWSSADGVIWTQESTDQQLPWWSGTINATVFNNELLAVSGGRVFTYSSTNHAFVPKGTPNAVVVTNTSEGRSSASLTQYNNQLWYIGGKLEHPINVPAGGDAMNDVWRSSDGVSWTQLSNAPFAPRFEHSAFVANGKLWVMGGRGATNGVVGPVTPDAWSTTDGIAWTKENANGLARGFLIPTVQEPGKATLIGGVQVGIANNVWQTTDGINWSERSSHAQFSPRISPQGVEFNGQMWIVGGLAADGGINDKDSNDIWRSSDGVNWKRVVTSGTIFSTRDAHGVVVFKNRMWVVGGQNNPSGGSGTNVRLNDVWSSADGVTWRQETAAAAFTPRSGPAATVFGGKLWVFGGCTSSTTCVNDVWSSDDGVTWVNASPSAAFSARGAGVVVFNNTLWMIGGETAAGVAINDVWRSNDGINWTQQTLGTHFAPRTRYGVQVLNGRLYVVGGVSNGDYATGVAYNDVWSSADGVAWRLDVDHAAFSPRSLHTMIAHNNELWIVAGLDKDVLNDVWRSSDGVNWRVGFSHDIAAP